MDIKEEHGEKIEMGKKPFHRLEQREAREKLAEASVNYSRIKRQAEELYHDHLISAIKRQILLSENAKSDLAKLAALKEIIERCLGKPIQRIEQDEKTLIIETSIPWNIGEKDTTGEKPL